ncbi:MAG: thiamine phosphate synthase [Gemmatimonadota bacterium]|nr:MAG: thiamine phosphate synthase [Gemmatimonadota bacterium]
MSARAIPDLRQVLRLMVITDRELAGDRGSPAVVEAALGAGATSIQLRDKHATSRELLETALVLRPLVERHRALFLVNDRFDVALAAGAHGVHLGDDDMPVAEVRRAVPRDFIIGRSADTEEAARAAEQDGADYLGVGSVFGTRTKKEVVGEVIGTKQMGRVAAAVSIPVVGIGGITPDNAAEVAAAGAAGVAVISAVMAAPDPEAAVRSLLEAWERGKRCRPSPRGRS